MARLSYRQGLLLYQDFGVTDDILKGNTTEKYVKKIERHNWNKIVYNFIN